jgi:hypothetical protein
VNALENDMVINKKHSTYDEDFLNKIFQKFHDYELSVEDYNGLADMINPIEALAKKASIGLNFDDEPADFVRALTENKQSGAKS